MAVNAERMAIQEINDVGGLLGMKIVPVIADGESDPDVRIRFLICILMFSLEFFLILYILFSYFCILDFSKICILPKENHYFQGFRLKYACTISVYFSFKKSSKNQSKIESQRLKNQCQKRAFF